MTDPVWRAVEQVMGLPISVALRGRHAGSPAGAATWAAVVDDLRAVDAAYSSYLPDSWVSRRRRGEDAPAPEGLGEVLDLAEQARRQSGGAFDVRRGDVLDLDGVVKGWAVARAAQRFRALDETDSCLSGGGDMACWTADPDGRPWEIGIEHPLDPGRLVARVPVARGAVATSGTAHRGAHIVDARTGLAPAGLASVTVIGADLTWVDIEATAAFALGVDGIDWLRARPGRSGLVVHTDGTVEAWSSADAYRS
ncbi:FAD:protein FMN transferase [Nocardioides mangrovi]|uniref:FAD:protein FMN transferase n=1 Tax=Nocardioides mangrovi TaxID=2874580 RepID=A0ABS7UCR9_9ACTN|nr:FAD:protein FMN transferase [Nocardioides mangrovi]MBZ5738587.1 FAD:protein FMN transferase [Nocardioides mangrovi]